MIRPTTLSLTNALGVCGTLWLFAAINALAVLFVFRCIPETRGRSLEEIEAARGTYRDALSGTVMNHCEEEASS
ncbi:MFS transporter [Streptomyces sp. NPDC057580]|uniref:MFS transporter n=1 Tax=Streptomyces sp. NPDC057580 TaxID=3346173 RepID=UPI0036C5BA65